MKTKITTVYVIVALLLNACGHDGASGVSGPEANVSTDNTLADLINSSHYNGALVVHLNESLKSRAVENKFISKANGGKSIDSLNSILRRHQGTNIIAAHDGAEDEADAARAHLERISGTKLADFNSIYHLKTSSAEDAVELLEELRKDRNVARVYPSMKRTLTSLATTPSLTGHQGYLYAEETHGGLNAPAIWAEGARGEDVYVFDNDDGVNFDHEDLGLTLGRVDEGGSYYILWGCVPGVSEPPEGCDMAIAHGTAVAGILSAKDDGRGVTGFAPASRYVLAPYDMSTFHTLYIATDGIDTAISDGDNNIEPGSIWVIETSLPGRYYNYTGGDPSLVENQYGKVPTELWPEDFLSIQQATAFGVTVVSGAGNGQMDLNDETLYEGEWSFAHNLAHEDAGSIMVGASEGANKAKVFFSECGRRVNAFSWGLGVVTTGMDVGLYGWNGTAAPVPPNDDPNSFFVDNFGGTSSAAAIVGGAATLLQSYARRELGGHKRYLMPVKMREFIVSSGVPQTDGGCNIGTQPRLDVAKTLTDGFILEVKADYPELENGELLTFDRMVALRGRGVGIICKQFDEEHSDPICPDFEIYPPGSGIGKDYDFDADGRADLVQWTNGTWKLDLSSRGEGGDNYGAWDIEITHPPIEGRWVWPYVDDMNSDGRTDFVVYDKEHGTWYIAFTDIRLIRDGVWHGWDWVLDYSSEWVDDLKMDPWQSNYSRPMIGDYDADGWRDVAIACSDGFMRVDFGGPNPSDFGTFDRVVRYLSEEELAAAPGWAYLTVPGEFSDMSSIVYRVPDGLPDAGQLHGYGLDDRSYDIFWWVEGHSFGGNDTILQFVGSDIGFVSREGTWPLYNRISGEYRLDDSEPLNVYGTKNCHPIVADFDADGLSDRAVMCPDRWRIVYTRLGILDAISEVGLGYDTNVFSLPGRSYAGGIGLAHSMELIEFGRSVNPAMPPPIVIDMPSFSSK